MHTFSKQTPCFLLTRSTASKFSSFWCIICLCSSTGTHFFIESQFPNFFRLEKCHKCGITKNLSEFFRTWKMSQMWQKPIRNFSDLKIVITTGGSTLCKVDITKNLSEIFRTWKMSRMRHHKKPIRIFSYLKNVTNEC